MKLVSLNTWSGTIYEPLMEFIRQQSVNTDIFCFQEVFSSLPGAPLVSSGARMYLLGELQQMLPDFFSFFDLRSSGCDFNGPIAAPVSQGLAVFVNKRHEVCGVDSHLLSVTKHSADHLIKAQVVMFKSNGQELAIINTHGLPLPGDKLDTKERISQSQQLALIWKSLAVPAKILCGDFNLMPQTESIKILRGCGRDLIQEFKIQNTRNEISWKRFNNKQYFADYCFVSPAIKVLDFSVPYNEISDHLPMVLDFEI